MEYESFNLRPLSHKLVNWWMDYVDGLIHCCTASDTSAFKCALVSISVGKIHVRYLYPVHSAIKVSFFKTVCLCLFPRVPFYMQGTATVPTCTKLT